MSSFVMNLSDGSFSRSNLPLRGAVGSFPSGCAGCGNATTSSHKSLLTLGLDASTFSRAADRNMRAFSQHVVGVLGYNNVSTLPDNATKLPAVTGGGGGNAWKSATPIAARDVNNCDDGIKEIGPVCVYHDVNDHYPEWAANAGFTIIQPVRNISDLIEAIRTMVEDCKCIKGLFIRAHGGWKGQGGFRMGEDANGDGNLGPGEGVDDVASGGTDGTLLGQILRGAFCPGATVCFSACGGASGSFLKNFAMAAGCDAMGTTGDFHGRSDGSYYVSPDGSTITRYTSAGHPHGTAAAEGGIFEKMSNGTVHSPFQLLVGRPLGKCWIKK